MARNELYNNASGSLLGLNSLFAKCHHGMTRKWHYIGGGASLCQAEMRTFLASSLISAGRREMLLVVEMRPDAVPEGGALGR